MRRGVHIVLVVLVAAFVAHAKEEPVQLETYKVEERPFGFLGIKHATLALSPLKLIVGMNSVKFLQIDELEAGSPGIAAGVLPGDRVVSIDGVAVTKVGLRKLRRMGSEVEVGQKLKVEVLRPSDGSTRVMEVVVPKKPQTPNQSPQRNPDESGSTPGSRPSSGDSPASETPSSLGPRG